MDYTKSDYLGAREMLAAAGFEIVTTDFDGRLYGAYTCLKAPS